MTGVDLLVVWATLIAAISTFFELLEKSVSDEARNTAGCWLCSKPTGDQCDSWQVQIINTFDVIYGKRIASKKFLFRSAITSVLTILVSSWLLLLVVASYASQKDAAITYPTSSLELEQTTRDGHTTPADHAPIQQEFKPDFLDWIVVVAGVLPAILLYNLIPDALSLIETRLVLEQMAKEASKKAAIFFLAYDLVLTIGIYIGYTALVVTFGVGTLKYSLSDLPAEFEFTLENRFHLFGAMFGIGTVFAVVSGFFSTFVTSIWIYLYILTGILYRSMILATRPFHVIREKLLDGEKQPFRIMGITLSVALTIVMLPLCVI